MVEKRCTRVVVFVANVAIVAVVAVVTNVALVIFVREAVDTDLSTVHILPYNGESIYIGIAGSLVTMQIERTETPCHSRFHKIG